MFIKDVICENCSSVESETRMTRFTMCRTLKWTPSVLEIFFQRSMLDCDEDRSEKNQYKVVIPSELFITISSQKDNISYTLFSLIMNGGNSLYSRHYFRDVFDVNTEIWWYCDDDEITQIGDFIESVYTRETHKQKYTKKEVISGSKKVIFVVYIIIGNLIASNYV